MLKNWVFAGSGDQWKFLSRDVLHSLDCVFMETNWVLACSIALRDQILLGYFVIWVRRGRPLH